MAKEKLKKVKIDYAFYSKYYGDRIIKICDESINNKKYAKQEYLRK